MKGSVISSHWPLRWPPALAQQPDLARGRYVATIGGCNDCHTAGSRRKAARCRRPNAARQRGRLPRPWGHDLSDELAAQPLR